MIEAIGEDPVLRDTKMIAEAWDAAGLYQVGSFSSDPRWAEWNGRFRDDVRAFMLSRENTVSQLATRIAGSSDLYQASGRSPLCSINFITSHDGFTLLDLVSYNHKDNRANGEENRDGENHNLSWNSGHEGPGEPSRVRRLRLRRVKTFLAILLFSQGVPMLCAGDEFARSQRGNNNAWCQDNQTSWLDWSLLAENHGLFRFVAGCIALRQRHPLFRRDNFFPAKGALMAPPRSNGNTSTPAKRTGPPTATGWPFSCGPGLTGARTVIFSSPSTATAAAPSTLPCRPGPPAVATGSGSSTPPQPPRATSST
jgi:isoamylase